MKFTTLFTFTSFFALLALATPIPQPNANGKSIGDALRTYHSELSNIQSRINKTGSEGIAPATTQQFQTVTTTFINTVQSFSGASKTTMMGDDSVQAIKGLATDCQNVIVVLVVLFRGNVNGSGSDLLGLGPILSDNSALGSALGGIIGQVLGILAGILSSLEL